MLRNGFLLFAPDDGGAGSTSTGEGDGQPGVTDTQTGGDKPGFTQADLDRVAGQTRKEALSKWAKEHGFGGISDLEALIKAKNEADDKAKSDLDKARDEAQREKSAREATEKRLYTTILRGAFDRAAGDRVADLDLAYLAAEAAGLLNGDGGIVVEVETGKVSGLDKVIDKLLKDKPILKKASQATPGGTGGAAGSTQAPAKTPEKEAEIKRRFGIG